MQEFDFDADIAPLRGGFFQSQGFTEPQAMYLQDYNNSLYAQDERALKYDTARLSYESARFRLDQQREAARREAEAFDLIPDIVGQYTEAMGIEDPEARMDALYDVTNRNASTIAQSPILASMSQSYFSTGRDMYSRWQTRQDRKSKEEDEEQRERMSAAQSYASSGDVDMVTSLIDADGKRSPMEEAYLKSAEAAREEAKAEYEQARVEASTPSKTQLGLLKSEFETVSKIPFYLREAEPEAGVTAKYEVGSKGGATGSKPDELAFGDLVRFYAKIMAGKKAMQEKNRLYASPEYERMIAEEIFKGEGKFKKYHDDPRLLQTAIKQDGPEHIDLYERGVFNRLPLVTRDLDSKFGSP